jgi:ankyrin repeat protein
MKRQKDGVGFDMAGKNSVALAGNGKKPDPIVEKVLREGLFGSSFEEFSSRKPEPELPPAAAPRKSFPTFEATNDLKEKLGEQLVLAAQDCRTDEVKELLRMGADINYVHNEKTALLCAVEKRNLATIWLLLEANACPDVMDNLHRTALYLISANNMREEAAIAEMLITSGADVNLHCEYGHTPLIAAGECGHITIAKLLLNAGAVVDAWDDRGRTALMAACERGRAEIAKILMDLGADIHTPDKDGSTPLMHACTDFMCAKMLVDAGANVNVADARGETPLMTACGIRNIETVKLLLEHGADVNAKDENGTTAVEYVGRKKGSAKDILDLLKNAVK